MSRRWPSSLSPWLRSSLSSPWLSEHEVKTQRYRCVFKWKRIRSWKCKHLNTQYKVDQFEKATRPRKCIRVTKAWVIISQLENILGSTLTWCWINSVDWFDLSLNLQSWPRMLEQFNSAKENWNMTFDFPHSPISMLQSVFTKLPDVLPATFFNIEWGRWGIVILVMIWGKNMQFFDCSKVFWPEL